MARPGFGVRPARARRASTAALALSMALGALVMAGCDWTQLGAGAGRAYNNPREAQLTAATVDTLHEVFSVPVGLTEPIIVGSSGYTTLHDGFGGSATVEAWNAGTGVGRWSVPLLDAARTLTGVVSAGGHLIVAVLGTDGITQVSALSRVDGAVIWEKDLPGTSDRLGQYLAVIDGQVVLTRYRTVNGDPLTGTTEVAALTIDTGTMTWSRNVTGLGTALGALSRYVVVSHALAAAGARSQIDVLAIADGSTVWTRGGSPEASLSAQMAAGQRLFTFGTIEAASSDHPIIFDVANGTLLWEGSASGVSAPRASTDRVAVSVDVNVTALDTATGAVRWSVPAPGDPVSAPTIAGSLVYVVAEGGSGSALHAYDLSTGDEVADVPVAGSSLYTPVVANGRVYLSDGSVLHAYAPA